MENIQNTKRTRVCPFKKFVKSIPMATCGLALGLAALGNLLKLVYNENGEIPRYICGGLSFAVLVVFSLKLIFDRTHAKEELKTPIPASVLATATMALMLLCALVSPFIPNIAASVWYSTVFIQLCIMGYFFKKFLMGFRLNTAYPSWFIVFVGIVVASVTAPAFKALMIGQITFYIGFTFYFICLGLVVARMIKIPKRLFAEPARPTIAIFSAPMSLLVVGYFSSFVTPFNGALSTIEPSKPLIYAMLAIAAISYLYVLAMSVPLLLKGFYPTYSSFTFPLVISAIAFRLGANFIMGLNESLKFLSTIADITQWIAIVAVAYVFAEYIRYFIYWLKF